MLFFEFSIVIDDTCSININQLINANIVKLITQRSVLLSTKTRKAHIPLISRRRNHIRHNQKLILYVSFDQDNQTNLITLSNAHNQNIRESRQLILFIKTANVSGAIVNVVNGLNKLNQ